MSDSENLTCLSNAAQSQQAEQPTCGRTENTVTTKLSVQQHLSAEIEEQHDDLSPVAGALQQPLQQAPLLIHETRVPMAPETIGDLTSGSPGPDLPQRSLIVHSSSSVCACSELSFEGPAERVRSCGNVGLPPPQVAADNELAHQLAEILHTTRSTVLCRTITMEADDCRKMDSGFNVVGIEDAQDIANSLSHKHESVRNGTPDKLSSEARQVPAPGTSTTGVTIFWGGKTSDVVHGQADDTLDAQRTISQSVADREEVNQVKMDDHKARSFDSTLPAAEINADLNATKLPDCFDAAVTRHHPTGTTKSGSKTQDGIHLEARIQNTAGVAKVSSRDGIFIDDIENAPAKLAAKTTSCAGVFETYQTKPTPDQNETSHAEDALKPPSNYFNKHVPATHSKSFHAAATPETFVPCGGRGRKVADAVPGDKLRSWEPLSATEQKILRSKPPRFERLESTVTEEESLELHPEQLLQQRYTSQIFRATSSNPPFGQVVAFENSLFGAFDNANPTTCNSSTLGPLIDDPPNSRHIPSEQNSSETSFPEFETTARSLQFADRTDLRNPETSATQMRPRVTSSQMSFQVEAPTVSPAMSVTGYEATQEVVVRSTDVSSPSPFCSAVRSDAFDESSSSSAQADGFQVSKQLHLFEGHEALAMSTNDVQSNSPSNRFTSAELGVPLPPMYNSPPTWKTEAKAAVNGQQQCVLDRGGNPFRNHEADTSAAFPPTASTDTRPKQSFVQPFGYNLQGGDQDWMPYSRYKVPSKDTEKNFVTAEQVPFQPYFLNPALRGHRRGVRIPQVQAVVATATGQFPSPRGMRASRGLPPLVWRNRPFYRSRAPSAYREKRYGYPLNPHGMPESRGLRAAMSAQHTLGMGTNFGQTQRRNLYPPNGMIQPLQHRAMSPNYAGVQYWDNTHNDTSCQGGYYGGVNPEGSPFFFNTSGRSPSAEVASRRRTKLDQRIAGRQHVLQAGSLSTFDSHIDVDEPLTLKQRTSVAFKKWPSPSQQKATSAKKVQTEPRHTSATHSKVLDNTGQKIIKPRAQRHVGIDDSNTDLRNIPYTFANTQTEHSIPPWTTTGSPHQPNLGDAIHFHAFCGGTPSSRYINQNVVCPQYPPYIHPNLQTPAPVQCMPSAESHLPRSVAQPPYYATTQLQGNRDVNQRVVVPKKTRSSPERGAACPLSSCFRGVSHCDDYDSEEKPRKPRRCHHHAGRRGKSPLPPPFAMGSKFSVGYVMNFENELNPVLVPVNAHTAPPATSAARSAGSVTVAVQSQVASSSCETEEDPVAEIQVRVQKQLVQIEKAIKEQDMRRKVESKKTDNTRGNKLREDKRVTEQPNQPTHGSIHGKTPQNIGNAETPESSSSSDSQPEPSSWFSWSHTSRSRKGEKHRIAHKLATSVPSGKETEDESRSYYTSREKVVERHEMPAIPGASSSKASRDRPTFSWSTRGKAAENGNIHSSGEAFGDRPTFTWTTRKKAAQDRSVQSSPRGSIFQKEYSTHERKRSPPRLAAKSCDTSPNDSPKRRNATSRQRSPGRTTAESAWRTRPHKNSSSPVRSELSAELPHSYEADPRADASLLANARVALPGDKRTQRRWSRTEMHRSTSYDTAASSVAPSSTKERRTRSEEHLKVQRSPKLKSNTPSSWWASMCSLFKGPNQPESPSPKTRRLSAENATERSDAAEKKAGYGGGMLSGIFNWFPSRSADKPDKARGQSAGSKEDSGSSFKEWITEKERALKKAQAKLNARKNKAQKRQASAAEGESEIPEDPYFVDDGGSRWAIRSSPSPSESVSHSPKYESATAEVVTPYIPPGPSAYGAPVSVVRCTFGDSGERPGAVPFQQQSGLATSADQDWSLQYIYGGPGTEVPVTRPPEGKPTPPVADSNVPPLYTFRDEPDWVLRITQGRERSKSSVGSATSQRAYPRKSSLSAEWKMEEPSFTARPTEVQSGQRKGSITASLSERPKKKRSSVSFEEDKEGGTPSQSKPHEAPEKSTYTKESAQLPPAVASPMAPAIAPAPVPPLAFNTEETFKHEFYEEMDERGRAALSAPAYERRSSIHEATASAAAKMEAIDTLFNSRSGKTSDITGEYGVASTAADHPLSGIAPQAEKRSGLAGTQRTSLRPPDSLGAEPPQPPTPEKRIGVAKAGRRSSAPETASAADAETNADNKNKDANDEQFKAAAFARLAPGDPTHTNYVLQQRTPRKVQLNQSLSHECPTVQEVAGYAIVAAVVLLGLVLLVSVPRMRFHAMGM